MQQQKGRAYVIYKKTIIAVEKQVMSDPFVNL